MAGFAKGILIAMVASVAMVIMMNLAFFFPWYITVIETAFEVSQVVANENYLPGDDYHNIYNELKSKPIFKERASSDKLYIKVNGPSRKDCKETVTGRNADYYYNMSEGAKPYVQQGNQLIVVVGASYPFQMNIGGRQLSLADIPVEVPIKTTALKYYKDLNYYFR